MEAKQITDLSLFDLEATIHDVVTLWQEADTPEAMEQTEQALIALAAAEVQKVDGWRRYMKMCRDQERLANEEAQLQRSRASLWKARYDRMANLAMVVMEGFGKKKLEGKTGSILLKGNGGLQALTISDPSLIPDDCAVMEIRVPASRWKLLVAMCERYGVKVEPLKADRVPWGDKIREKLASPCGQCNAGKMVFPPSRESGRKYPLVTDCTACGGSGLAGVAGASLEPRGSHIEVK